MKDMHKYGFLAFSVTGKKLPLNVLQSAAGFYIGTFDEEGAVSRESNEYFRSFESCNYALQNGEWSQKENP